ncbi:MAG: hypothetical protein ACSHX6_16180 [Akkermansiaceae bacterium]
MSNKKSKDKKLNGKITGDAELRLADDDVVEVLPLSVDEVEDVGELVEPQKVKLFESDVLVDRVEHDNDDELGKSFRSKELNESDLTARENMPTLEDQWVEDRSNSSNVSWVNRFIIVGILLVVAAGIWAFTNLSKEEIIKEQREKELKELVLQSEENDAAHARNEANIEECVKGYLEATTIEERAKWCRHSEETLLKMTKHYDHELTFANHHFEGILKSSVIDILKDEVTIISAKVSSMSGEMTQQDKPKMLLLEKQDDGSYRVDWETAVIYQPSDWDKFVESRSSEPHVFRIEAKDRIDYGPYLYAFSDDNKFQAYRISLRDEAEKFLIGYAEKDSDVDKKLKRLVKKSGNKKAKKEPVSLTLKVAYPKDAESDQCVEILEVVSETWFVP